MKNMITNMRAFVRDRVALKISLSKKYRKIAIDKISI